MAEEESIRERSRFKSPEEELTYLRERVAFQERESGRKESGVSREELARQEIHAYAKHPSEDILPLERQIAEADQESIALGLAPETHDIKMAELFVLLKEKGVRNTLSIVEKMKNPHIEDDFHRLLVQYVKKGLSGADRGEEPLWKLLHMTLYEISVPEHRKEKGMPEKYLKELLASMEQFYSGMISSEIKGSGPNHFTFEIAVADGSDEIIFYAAIPDHKKDLFEKQLLAIFPLAQINEQKDDYNIFVEGGVSCGSRAHLLRNSVLPLKTYEHFEYDPLNVILNTFSKIERNGGGAALQFVFTSGDKSLPGYYRSILKKMQEGKPFSKAVSESYKTNAGEFIGAFKSAIFGESAQPEKSQGVFKVGEDTIEAIREKLASSLVSVNIRLVSSSKTKERALEILTHLESAFHQFENTHGNGLSFSHLDDSVLRALHKDFSFRSFYQKYALPLGIKEVATLIHLPPEGIKSSPQFKQSRAGQAPAPVDVPSEGTLLGVNRFRGAETKVYFTEEDRLRHFYVIGQTGTGKTTLLKNMITQDIMQGEGVCMIDPHGTDIQDVLGIIPKERYEDVIYFDPSNLERVMALNMLEYDERFPEQKTFVVNELFSIFQKLYGAVPESMGPIFEQYFRNATQLVLEDPASGSTLLDVSRVLADEEFRNLKLSRCKNPIIAQFWREIATKAGGESALANIVPYITSKFDVFTANDYMRPIIAQQKSSLHFREIMDEKKILLVNLSKGRLGDINSNLLGLILVGKILMAALSRVDAVGRDDIPPFYLYIDEFQNVTTDSIATILSEARKYKLSLNIAHQFIAQLDEKIMKAVFGNVGSLAVFRVGAEDAEFLVKQFEAVFTENDLLNIENRNAYIKLLVHGKPVKPFSVSILPPEKGDIEKVQMLKELACARYARPREEIEEEIRQKYNI